MLLSIDSLVACCLTLAFTLSLAKDARSWDDLARLRDARFCIVNPLPSTTVVFLQHSINRLRRFVTLRDVKGQILSIYARNVRNYFGGFAHNYGRIAAFSAAKSGRRRKTDIVGMNRRPVISLSPG